MVDSLFPLIYGLVVSVLLWQAFKVMRQGFSVNQKTLNSANQLGKKKLDRTGLITIHPELLDQDGRLTEEELLTVRFSGDADPPQSAETSAE